MFSSMQKTGFENTEQAPQSGYGSAADLNSRSGADSRIIASRMAAVAAARPMDRYVPSDLAAYGYGGNLIGGCLHGRGPCKCKGGCLTCKKGRQSRGGSMNAVGDPNALLALRGESTWGPATLETTGQLTHMPALFDPLTHNNSAMAGMYGGGRR